MTVQESLQLSSLSSARVIAGHKGLDHTITSTMVLEATDIENWGRGGQLLITSFFALHDLSAEELADFFSKMATIGISALVFKPERLLHSAPTNVVQLCNHHSIPLLQVPKETKYESILMDVLGHILDSNLTLLNHFFDVHNQMMSLALQQPTAHQILHYLKKELHADATFYAAAQEKRVTSDAELGSFVRFDLHALAADHYRHYQYYHAQLHYISGFSANALAVTVPSSDGNQYYLFIHDGNRSRKSIDIMTIENVVSLLQMEILKQNAIDQKLFIQNNNAIHDLLNGRYSSHERVDSSLTSLGLDRHPLYQVLLISVHLAPEDESYREDVMSAVRRQIKMLYPKLAYFENNDQITFLHNYAGGASALQTDSIQRALSRISREGVPSSFTYLVALSRSKGRYAIDTLTKEVMDICRLFDSRRQDSRCIRYEDLGIYKIFLDTEHLSDLETFIDPRILKLKQESPELLSTLVVLCDSGLNFQETARRLFLHPKTIHYRIQRIQQLYALDIHDTDDYMQILLAGKILLLLNEHP